MPRNNSKGKRVERLLVQWLRERGIQSARRSQQYAGNSTYGNADVLADELPKFHIESKGTKNTRIIRSVLYKWWKQIHKDVRDGQLPVIFHIANLCDPVVLLPYSVAEQMRITPTCIKYLTGDAITPIEHSNRPVILDNLFSGAAKPNVSTFFVSAYTVAEGATFLILNSDDFLEIMKAHV